MWVICPLMLNTWSKCIWVDVVAVYSTLLQQIGRLETKKKSYVFFVWCLLMFFGHASGIALGTEMTVDWSVYCFDPD